MVRQGWAEHGRLCRARHEHGRLVGMQADPELITLDLAAQSLGVSIKRVHQLLSDGDLVAIRGEDGIRRVPSEFLGDGAVVKTLPSVITLLRDAHYEDSEIIEW